MANVRVEVTAEDIARGRAGSSNACPVSLALFRATGREWCASYPALSPAEWVGERILPTPAEVGWWMEWYDDQPPGEPPEPFGFDLDVPDAWLRRD